MLLENNNFEREFRNGKFLEKFPNVENTCYKFDDFTDYLGRRYDYIVINDLCEYFEKEVEELTEDDIEEASEGFGFYDWLKEKHYLGERYDL